MLVPASPRPLGSVATSYLKLGYQDKHAFPTPRSVDLLQFDHPCFPALFLYLMTCTQYSGKQFSCNRKFIVELYSTWLQQSPQWCCHSLASEPKRPWILYGSIQKLLQISIM